MNDPDFGQLTYMYISNNPAKSYWEAEWLFAPTGTSVSVALNGDETGPNAAFRDWYLGLPSKFNELVMLAKPELTKVFKKWLNQDIPEDLFKVVKLTGFGVEDPLATTIDWEMSFETIGEEWLGITIPFHGAGAMEATIDT